MISPANSPTSRASSTIQTAWQKRSGHDPQVFIPLFISLILAAVGSTRNRAVDQCGQAEALERSRGHRRSGRIHWRPPPVGGAAAESGQGRRFEAAANAGVDVPCSTMASREIL